MAKVYIDKNYIKNLFADVAVTEAKKIILEELQKEVQKANRDLLRTFLSNRITQEIKAGSKAENLSGTLGGKGNLFSFLGFRDGQDPIEEIVTFLTNSIKITSINTNKNSYTVLVNISIPTVEDVKELAQLPWINRGLVDAIEKGISGLGQYLYSEYGFETSRSSTGIQLTKNIFKGSMKPQKYLSVILETIANRIVDNIKA